MREIVELAELWAPGADHGFVAADEADIEWLEVVTERPLPPAYLRFLATMGGGTGPVRIDDVDTTIASIVSRYDLVPWTPPPRYVCFGIDTDAMAPMSFYLDRDRVAGDDCAVVRFPFPEEDDIDASQVVTVSKSLLDFLIWAAFTSMRCGMLAASRLVVPPAPVRQGDARLPLVRRVAADLGLERQACGGTQEHYHGAAGGLLIAYDPADSSLQKICVATADEKALLPAVLTLDDVLRET